MFPGATCIATALPFAGILRPLGGIGLALLGIVGSVVPLPGSVEALAVVLAARHRELWWYYTLAATAGSVAGGCIPYSLGWKGGTQLLIRRLSPRQAELWTERLRAWGFGAVAASGLLPPPLPATPVLLAAGAIHYSRRRFITALAVGRAVRFGLLVLLAATHGRKAIELVEHYLLPLMLISLAVTAGYAVYSKYFAGRRGALPEGSVEEQTY